MLSVDGGPEKRLTVNGAGQFLSLRLSADGKRLTAALQTVSREVWKAPLTPDAEANGKSAVRLLDESVDPMWLDAARSVPLLLVNSALTGSRNLWTVDLLSPGHPRQITMFAGNNLTHAGISPDGSRVAYTSLETGNAEIWTVNVDGSNPQQITHHPAADFWPSWSPDAKWLLFGSVRSGSPQLWKVAASGGEPEQITRNGGVRGNWSPTGDRIAYASDGVNGIRNAIEVSDLSGKVELQIPYDDADMALPTWSPDGRRFTAVHRERGDCNSVWIFDAQTGKGYKAVQFPAKFNLWFRACWTVDGKSVVVNRQELVSNVVLLENFW
jgi:Tol biopolymer transport system component